MGMGGKDVNKAELIEALVGRLGDRKSATAALDAVLAEIQNAVTKGDKVAITGFGVFEKRVRAARTARNPRTGEAVKVKKTSVPAFRAGRELPGDGRRRQGAEGRPRPPQRRPRRPPAKAVKATAVQEGRRRRRRRQGRAAADAPPPPRSGTAPSRRRAPRPPRPRRQHAAARAPDAVTRRRDP